MNWVDDGAATVGDTEAASAGADWAAVCADDGSLAMDAGAAPAASFSIGAAGSAAADESGMKARAQTTDVAAAIDDRVRPRAEAMAVIVENGWGMQRVLRWRLGNGVTGSTTIAIPEAAESAVLASGRSAEKKVGAS